MSSKVRGKSSTNKARYASLDNCHQLVKNYPALFRTTFPQVKVLTKRIEHAKNTCLLLLAIVCKKAIANNQKGKGQFCGKHALELGR